MISASGVSVLRGGRRVLSDVSFAVGEGEVHAILGPNGAGKSTLLRACMGLMACAGRITLDGRPLTAWSRSERAQRIAYVPQQSALMSDLPVTRVVAQGRYAFGQLQRPGAGGQRHIDEAMARADVTALADRPFTRLSFGERRRVLLARALATEARVLLLDEPTSSLDVGHVLGFHRLIGELRRDGYAVAMVLHDLDEAARFCDSATLLAEGRVAAGGPIAQVVESSPVRAVYGVLLRPQSALGFELLDAAPAQEES